MARITILDGGMGQELVHRAGGAATPLWSTQVMIDAPDLVGELHRDFLTAGARVIATNTYAVLPDRLASVGMADRFEPLIDVALQQAEAARADFPGAKIAGSLGPLRASYRPDLCPPAAEAALEYAPSVALMKGRVDLFMLETMCSVDQADGALRAACGQGLPVWLVLSVDDDDGTRLRSGEPLASIAPLIKRHAPEAVLLNCARPEAIGQGLGIIADLGPPFGAYANGFTRINDAFREASPTVDVLEHRQDLDPATYADFVMGWVAAGATIVGGCCEVGPNHIAEISRRLA